ncbi:DUF6445 family protein [Cellvibrio sp. pealriver]|uniref:DUF6445 family protein n=1 Tax=Cellvibrio sp. pealriver TaxID=1622269 RepID=UPI00066FEB97|nr:DUF6445 family protein [Cellvibrio sp. pealriver]
MTLYSQEKWKIDVQLIGHEKNPLLIIDNFCNTPNALTDQACSGEPFIAQASDFYPGLRKQVDGNYPAQSLNAITSLVREVFSIDASRAVQQSLCAFSLTTTPPEKLRPIQSVPHIDTHDPSHFAMVHYLCPNSYGGTSFYRHRSTGHESITQERLTNYFKILKQEVMEEQQTRFNYINGDTHLFERIAQVPVAFNRAVIYRSNQLHSGDISAQLGLSENPKQGRLTVNSFFSFIE